MNTQTQEALHKALKVLNCLNNDRVYETAWVKGAINACEEALAQPLTRDWKETIDERIAKDDMFKEALAQPAQEPVSLGDFDRMTKAECVEYIDYLRKEIDLLRFKEWQGLSDDEVANLINEPKVSQFIYYQFAHVIEQALKEKNHGI